jgi:hypothetical protein
MDNLTNNDVNNAVELAKKFIVNNDFEELNNNILYGGEFNNFRRIYPDNYVDVIYYIIIEYGDTVQTGGIIPLILGVVGRKVGQKVGQKVVTKKLKSVTKKKPKDKKLKDKKSKDKKSKKYKLKKKLSKRAKGHVEEQIEEEVKEKSWW